METTLARIQLRKVIAPKVATARRVAEPVELAPASPIVKWVGGKTKLLAEIGNRAPSTYRRYFEPFFGGGAVFFSLAPTTAVVSDVNRDLVNTYRCVAWNVEGVIRKLRTHRQRHNEDYYYAMRERWNDDGHRWSNVDRAAAFIYLNKTCFNGLWRVNRAGKFNVPMGRYKSPSICNPDALRQAATLLRRAEIRHGDYKSSLAEARAGDFVYLDPPYHPVSTTSNFTSYTQGGFSEDDQRELATLVKKLAANGVAVMVSNSDTPFIREIYDGLRIEQVMCPRAINSKASKRGAVAEVLVTANC